MAVLQRLLSTKRSKADQARVEQRFRDKLCTNKKETAPGSETIVDCHSKAGRRRNLCDACAAEFYRTLNSFGDDAQAAAEYEARMIREGLVLESGEAIRLNRTSLISQRRRKRA